MQIEDKPQGIQHIRVVCTLIRKERSDGCGKQMAFNYSQSCYAQNKETINSLKGKSGRESIE